MLNSQYISIKEILSSLYKNPLMESLNEVDVAEYIADCVSLIGAPMAYEDKVGEYKIENYRGLLPFDMLYIWQTRKKNILSDTKVNLEPMRYASDTFHSKYHKVGSPDFVEHTRNYDWTYSINNGWIYTNFKEGYVQQSYKGLKVDEDGLPMIPDNVKFKKAVENYVKAEWYRVLWELGKISDKVLYKAEQERDWYIGGANTTAQLQSIDQAETFKNSLTKLLSNANTGANSFQDLGRKEYIKVGSI
jgi:hypothetical protein